MLNALTSGVLVGELLLVALLALLDVLPVGPAVGLAVLVALGLASTTLAEVYSRGDDGVAGRDGGLPR